MVISNAGTVVAAISAVNECVTFFQWVKSLWSHRNRTENQEEDGVPKLQNSLGAHSSGTEKQELKQDDVLKLQSSLYTLSGMYSFTDQAQVLPEVKAAVCDMQDLLEDFRCYQQQKAKTEGSATSAEPGTKFFHDFIQSSFSKLIHIQQRLHNQYRLLEGISLHQATPRFNRSVRPETTSFPTEAKIFGRDDERKELIRILGVPDPLCLMAIEKFSGEAVTKDDNVYSLQVHLAQNINKRRFLVVLDDMWSESDELWKPFKHVPQGSKIIVKIVLCMNKDMSNALHRERQARKRDSKRIKRDLRQIKKLRTEADKGVSPSESEAEELEIESEGEQYPDFDALISQVRSEQQYGQIYALAGGYGDGFGGQFHPGASSSSALQQHQQYGQNYAPGGGYGFPYGFGGQFHPGASSSSALQEHQQYGQTYAPGGGYGYGFGGQFHPGASSSAPQQPPSQCQ